MTTDAPGSADAEPSPLPWTDETVWELVSGVLKLPDDAPDKNLYWHNASQGVVILMAALHILAAEFSLMDNGESRPALVRKIIALTMEHSDDIKQEVLRALLAN